MNDESAQMDATTMHRALRITEILRNICDLANERTLSNLARCCKATHEPAMQSLWSIVPNLVPLIKCFPADVWTIEDRKIRFTRVPWPEEWSTFLRNARLVRHLGDYYYPSSSWGVHENIIETLSSIRPVLVLFPHVRILDWHALGVRGLCLPSVLSMVGDLVTTVEIPEDSPIPEHTLCVSIAMIAARLHHLRSLKLTSLGHTGDLGYSNASVQISALICSRISLTAFESSGIPLTVNAIKSLAESKTIHDLRFRLPHGASWSSIQFPSQSFTPLTELSITLMVEAYIAFSKAAALPHLIALTLYVEPDLEPELFSELFTSIRRQCSPASLRGLFVRQEPFALEMQDETLVHGADLQPLLDFVRMERFELSTQVHYAFDDAFLLNMANAWPHLQMLQLATESFCLHDTFPSLAGVLSIVIGCKSLKTLSLTFNASSGVAEGLISNGVGATSGATSLDVGNSPIEELPHAITRFLALVFPKVQNFSHGESHGEPSEYYEIWDEVARYLPVLKSVREDERLRISREIEAGTVAF